MEDWQNGGFGIYLHWPFCQAKCPYCDFNSHVSRSIDHARWARAYLSELKRMRALTGGRVVKSVFFGGGTPSLMPPELVGDLLSRISTLWPQANDLEVTLEANPTSVEAGRFRGFRDAGVNRVSVGLQALNDADLQRLGRLHTVSEGIRAFDLARGTFPRASFDLIYARQHQTLAAWRAELGEALQMEAGHMSLYQLTIEDGTAFGDRYKRGKLGGLPRDDDAADMFFLTQEMCEAAGLPAYEVSNHARPGEECAHNLIYWTAGTYAGIGPGAHGRIAQAGARIETEAIRAPGAWLSAVETAGNGEFSPRAMSPREAAEEYLMMGLRIREGVSPGRLGPLVEAPDWAARVAMLEEAGMLVTDGGRLRATPAGMLLLNSVLRHLVA